MAVENFADRNCHASETNLLAIGLPVFEAKLYAYQDSLYTGFQKAAELRQKQAKQTDLK
jgi:hypothetical protein